MKIWVYLNDIQQGPYTLEEFASLPVNASTPVWYEGLERWMAAGEAPATAVYFGVNTEEPDEEVSDDSTSSKIIYPVSNSGAHLSLNDVDDKDNPCPPTYIGWSIFTLICCFPIGGIIALILSNMVSNYYRAGNYRSAQRMSEAAEWTIIISIVIGLMSMPLGILLLS